LQNVTRCVGHECGSGKRAAQEPHPDLCALSWCPICPKSSASSVTSECPLDGCVATQGVGVAGSMGIGPPTPHHRTTTTAIAPLATLTSVSSPHAKGGAAGPPPARRCVCPGADRVFPTMAAALAGRRHTSRPFWPLSHRDEAQSGLCVRDSYRCPTATRSRGWHQGRPALRMYGQAGSSSRRPAGG
jgi:hypothetical protein